MALAAKGKFGLEYIAITDHTKSLKLTRGLDKKQILDQANKISEINDKLKLNHYTKRPKKNISIINNNHHHRLSGNFEYCSSAEVNIMKDGSRHSKRYRHCSRNRHSLRPPRSERRIYIRMAVENNIKLVIDSDANHPVHFAFLKLGIGQARWG